MAHSSKRGVFRVRNGASYCEEEWVGASNKKKNSPQPRQQQSYSAIVAEDFNPTGLERERQSAEQERAGDVPSNGCDPFSSH